MQIAWTCSEGLQTDNSFTSTWTDLSLTATDTGIGDITPVGRLEPIKKQCLRPSTGFSYCS